MRILTFLSLLFIWTISSSCVDDPMFDDPPKKDVSSHNNDTIRTDDGTINDYYSDSQLIVTKFANNCKPHQSSACYQDYLFLVTQSRNAIYLYNMRAKRLLCSLSLDAELDYSSTGSDLYHCNQATFGVDFYEQGDEFPLLYISQRAREDLRCFVDCYRIIPFRTDSLSDFTSFEIQLVQTIYFPKMTNDNALGNVNCVIDQEKQLMYTYSRNNNKKDKNYGNCKISSFQIPNVYQPVVFLEDKDIIDSFQISCSAINMQGGCIKDGFLFIGQGYVSAGYIYMNVVDISQRVIHKRFDLLSMGVEWEPEGCFVYDGRIMVSSNDTNLWDFQFLSF